VLDFLLWMGILWMSFIAAEIVMLPNLFMSIFFTYSFQF